MERCLTIAAASAAVLLLSGCSQAFLNEGASQIRGIPAVDNTAASFDQTYFAPLSGDDPATGMLQAGTVDAPGDAVSVTLLSAFICDFHEAQRFILFSSDTSNAGAVPCGDERKLDGGGDNNRQTRGEIAILANVGERSEDIGLTVNPANRGHKARVIYYNDDVRESGQLINAANIPVYGPQLYRGKPFILELQVLELDNDESAQIKGLLSALAGIGGSAYPPASPVLGVLDALGASLLTGNQDDREFAYQAQFDVKGPAHSRVHRMYLREGYYALLRRENRSLDPPWHEIALDRKRGLLVWAADQGDARQGQVYREHTWVLLRVAREELSAAVDNEVGQLFGEFLTEKREFDQANLDKLTARLKALADSVKQVRTLKGDAEAQP